MTEAAAEQECSHLCQPPPSFHHVNPPPSRSPTRTSASDPPSRPSHPDLITRYNLSSRLATASQEAPNPETKAAWSNDKNERQKELQRRREEMVLRARRKLEAKSQAQVSGSS